MRKFVGGELYVLAGENKSCKNAPYSGQEVAKKAAELTEGKTKSC